MNAITQQKVEPLSVLLIAMIASAAVVLGVAWPVLLPWSIAVAAGVVLVVFWAMKWDVTLWAWFWVLSYGFLNLPEWRVVVPGFFNFTPPRFVFLAGVLTMGLHLLFHRRRLRFNRRILWVMAAMILYVGVNAHIHGWTADTEPIREAPYFRYLGSIVLPMVMFFLLYNTGVNEKHIFYGLILLTVYGWYALYISYLQFIATRFAPAARALIFPGYINDPEYGIHFNRARGAFPGSSPQAILMVFLFFIDLYLIPRIRGFYRYMLIVQVVLVPPTIFFTYLRSGYLAFLVCWLFWAGFANRRRFRWLKVSLAVLVILVGTYVFWDRLSSSDRRAGGVAQVDPVRNRIILAVQTWEMFKKAPMTGVGFGHFVDAKFQIERDPASIMSNDVALLVQHNLFLNMLAETGLIGLVLTVLVLYYLVKESRGLYQKLPAEAEGILSRELVLLFWVFFLDWLVDANTRDPLWDPFSCALLWTFGGLIVCLNRRLEPQPLDLPIVSDPIGR